MWKRIGGDHVWYDVNFRFVNTLIIVNGDDDFLKERIALDEIAMSLAPSVHHFRFPHERARYLEFLDVVPLSMAPRVIAVWDCSEVPPMCEDATVIVVAAAGKNLKDDKAKRVVDVRKPKPYDGGVEYVKWILREGERLNIDLTRVASALFLNCGTDLRKICSEIGKLKVLLGPEGVADPSVARRVMCFSAELTPKHVVDAVCEGHPAKAIAFYDKLQERGCETGWIIAYMQRHVLQQLRSELLLSAGSPVEQVSSSLNVQPTFFRNVIMPRLGLWVVSSLRESLVTLCDLDLAHKRGVDVSRWGLEPEIIRLSEEARHNVSRHGS